MGWLDILCPIEKPKFKIGDCVEYKDKYRNDKYGIGKIVDYDEYDKTIVCKFDKATYHHYFSHRQFNNELEFVEEPRKNYTPPPSKINSDLYLPKGFLYDELPIGVVVNVRDGYIARFCGKYDGKVMEFVRGTMRYCINIDHWEERTNTPVAKLNYVKLRKQYYEWFLERYDFHDEDHYVDNKFFVIEAINFGSEYRLRFSYQDCGKFKYRFPLEKVVTLPSCLFEPLTIDEFTNPRVISSLSVRCCEQIDPTEELKYFFPHMFHKEENKMKLSDLKVGMVVETRECEKYIVLKNNEGKLFGMANSHFIGSFCGYNDDMTFPTNQNIDICKVYEIKNAGSFNGYASVLEKNNLTLLWKRNETKEIPMSEVMDILADKLGCEKNDIKITS